MRTLPSATLFASLLLVLAPGPASAVLEVTLDSGLGTQVFTDDDVDGDVDFNTTVDGIFQANGKALEELQAFKGKEARSGELVPSGPT